MRVELTLEKLAEEARHAFLFARDELKVENLPDADSERGWLAVADAFARCEGEQTVSGLVNLARTNYLTGAGLPADDTLADAKQRPAWVAVALSLHGMLTTDPDEWPEVRETSRLNARERMRGVLA